MEDVLDALEKRVRQDLSPFCDPGTTLSLTRQGRIFSASWKQRRKQREATFRVEEPAELVVEFGGHEQSYRSFFAGEEMADISGIAASSMALHNNGVYIATQATPEEPSSTRQGPAVELINELIEERSADGTTSFLMVTGQAGAGKTWVLKELVSRQALAYTQGEATFVYLYVDAQGRALAKFNEALSTELNDLRVGLPYHAVAAMVRLGLIVPVVDGFDELIGVGGYDDAFSSISSFVDDLNGSGALVASARSAYYEQEFLVRASRRSNSEKQSWRLTSASVLAWGEPERRQYVDSLCKGDTERAADLLQKLSTVFGGANADLASKPLFFTRVSRLLLDGEELQGEGQLTERLVEAFISRELRDKLLDRNGVSILDRGQLQALCEDMAEEMWNQSTRELDRPTVKYIAEVALSDASIPDASKSIVADRMPSMAFLQPGDASGSIQFEHEIFFDYFLASRFADRLSDKGALTNVLLGRSAMPDSLSDEVSRRIRQLGRPLVDQASVLSSSAKSLGIKQTQVRENCGRLFSSLLELFRGSDEQIPSFCVEDFIFPGSDLSNLRLTESSFVQCEFRRVNLANTVMVRCNLTQSTLEAPLVSQSTKLDVVGLDPESDVIGLRRVDEHGVVKSIYDPFEMRRDLRGIGFESLRDDSEKKRDVPPEIMRLIEKIARAYTRGNPVCFEQNLDHSIVAHPSWERVRKCAVSSGMLTSESRQTHGPKREFLRRTVLTEDITAGFDRSAEVPSSVRSFWDCVEKGAQ